ncbi:polyprenyl synthetase family protein [Paenibacillus sp. 11B]|uniref:polyprenyl synthetase family protein n=1 Tax=Paenibacillus TaxID=44249 RepID=UPI000B9FFF26|nr:MULTISPECIES: polyprenyl synthetase family protein [Paenibacillus]MDN8592884.1 polyprenyl synthetase family protein [Paenibacillus sp. 11B]OZQ67376.1 hypothetical protein CA599_17150 [Paenibacillus taichungensis]HBU84673.1 polyprenyl synthetase [Paenibacillus sp.]
MVEDMKIEQILCQAIEKEFTDEVLCKQAVECVLYKLQGGTKIGNLTSLHYQIYGGEGKAIYRAVAAVELLLLALDMIDDLQDRDNTVAVWSSIPQECVLNIALGFVFLSQHLLLDSDFETTRKYKAAALLNTQAIKAVNGQMMDLTSRILSESEYIQTVVDKSASLIVMACQIGTVLACGESRVEVEEYAEQLGLAAQIKNDILDVMNREGKNDFWNRKKTLPVLALIAHLNGQSHWVIDYFEGRLTYKQVCNRINELLELLENSGALTYASVHMRIAYYRYLRLVEQLPIQDGFKKRLSAVIES